MLKITVSVLAIVALLVVFGTCVHLYRVSQRNAYEMSKYSAPTELKAKTEKTLVVYYSLSGHTKKIAEQIAKLTNADTYEIKTAEPIKSSAGFYMQAKKWLVEEKYPELAEKLPDFSAYDTIFVGGPVWWYAPAAPLLTFLQKADFAARKVVPFSTQGSNYGSFFVDFNRMARNAKLRKSASFNNLPEKYDQAVENKIIHWINSID